MSHTSKETNPLIQIKGVEPLIDKIYNDIIEYYNDKKDDKAFEDRDWKEWLNEEINEQSIYHQLSNDQFKALKARLAQAEG